MLILLKNYAVRMMSGLFISQVSGQTECAVVTYGKDSWNVKSVHKWHRLFYWKQMGSFATTDYFDRFHVGPLSPAGLKIELFLCL